MRQCGDCQLCCKLLPVPPLQKKAGEKCRFQKFKTGCTIYHTSMPRDCQLWNCRWLVGDDTADLPRPDRARFVIDIIPDEIKAIDNETGREVFLMVVQVWCDPNHRDAWRTPDMIAYIKRRAEQGSGCLIRYDARKSLVVIAPPISDAWHERAGEGVEGVGLFRNELP